MFDFDRFHLLSSLISCGDESCEFSVMKHQGTHASLPPPAPETACIVTWGFQWTDVADNHREIIFARNSVQLPFFMEIYVTASWEIWKIQNGKILEGSSVIHDLRVVNSMNKWYSSCTELERNLDF